MLKLIANGFSTHKAAETPDDCQDAWDINEGTARYAVADGATRSLFPKQWAELLVNRFCEKNVLSLGRGELARVDNTSPRGLVKAGNCHCSGDEEVYLH